MEERWQPAGFVSLPGRVLAGRCPDSLAAELVAQASCLDVAAKTTRVIHWLKDNLALSTDREHDPIISVSILHQGVS